MINQIHKNLEIKRQQQAGERLLTLISDTFGEEAYLAGGMVRDHYFGKVGDDFDIFIKHSEGFDYDSFMEPMLNGLPNFHSFRKLTKEDGSNYNVGAIRGVYEGTYSSFNEDAKVQVIVLFDEVEAYVEAGFACSLGEAWKKRGEEPWYSSNFLWSANNNLMMFRFSGAFNHKYMEKIRAKFPDMEIDDTTKERIHEKVARESYWRGI